MAHSSLKAIDGSDPKSITRILPGEASFITEVSGYE